MSTFRAIAAAACFSACALSGSTAWGCDERFLASCKSKTSPQANSALAGLQDASSAKRSERRRSVRSERKRFRASRRGRAKFARLARYRRAEGRETEIAARMPMPPEAPHRLLKNRGFDPVTDFAQAGLLTPALLGGGESSSFSGPARPVSTAALDIQASKPIAVIAASHLLAASTSANAAEMLGMVPAKAAAEEMRSASLLNSWSESGVMRVLFLTLAGLLTFGTAVRLAM